MRIFQTALRAGLAAIALAAVSAAATRAEDYPEMTLRFAHFVPANFTGSDIDQWWADEIERRTNGKVKIEIYWAGSLGKAKELLDLVASGAVDMAATAQGYFPAKLPLTGATNSVMLGFADNEEAVRTTAEMVEIMPAIHEELKEANIWPVFFHSLGGYSPFCTTPIRTIGDFKGLKMRSWGEYVPLLWESLGATGVNVLPQENYEALERGTVDCIFWSFDSIYDQKLYEVAKYAWSHHFGAIPTWPVWVSWKNWHGGGWPENLKKLMAELGRQAMEIDIKQTAENNREVIKAMVEEQGVEVVQFQDWDEVVKTVPDLQEIWAGRMEQRGLGGAAEKLVEIWKANATPVAQWNFPLAKGEE